MTLVFQEATIQTLKRTSLVKLKECHIIWRDERYSARAQLQYFQFGDQFSV